ncbi:hypothetical protein Zmor_005774 [Zophobas morio]|uniref:Uncharacterized protein n=1 Tax=Zophobas morio TaxID=2755281 RepID=A0AA38IVX2_9CUCU|nr:hypothetical protein Zmor_005774 [Zophobas morio]
MDMIEPAISIRRLVPGKRFAMYCLANAKRTRFSSLPCSTGSGLDTKKTTPKNKILLVVGAKNQDEAHFVERILSTDETTFTRERVFSALILISGRINTPKTTSKFSWVILP